MRHPENTEKFSSDVDNFLSFGTPMPSMPLAEATEKALYAHALAEGNRRFAQPCQHTSVRQNTCTTCLRRILTR